MPSRKSPTSSPIPRRSRPPGLTVAEQARNRLGTAVIRGNPDEIAACRHDLEVAKLEQHIRDVVDASPRLTGEQAAKLRALLPDPGQRQTEQASA